MHNYFFNAFLRLLIFTLIIPNQCYSQFNEIYKIPSGTTDLDASADGHTIVLGYSGGPGVAWMPGVQGGVGIYEKSGNSWQLEQFIVSNDTFPSLGYSVAISDDGNTIAIGCPNNFGIGDVLIYKKSGKIWTKQGELFANYSSGDGSLIGRSVDISGDGNTVVVGDMIENSAWVFTWTGTYWIQVIQLKNKEFPSIVFGAAVAISGDGNTIIVGDYENDNEIGATWVFVKNGTTWIQQGGKLVGSDYQGQSQQGRRLDISDDGNTIITKGPGDRGGLSSAWIFQRNGTTWTEQVRLSGKDNSDGEDAYNPGSVAISSDGSLVVVGEELEDIGNGALWIYKKNGNSWLQVGPKLQGSRNTISPFHQGGCIAISDDNRYFIESGNINGFTWIFEQPCEYPSTFFIDTIEYCVSDNVHLAIEKKYSSNIIEWLKDSSSIVNSKFTGVKSSILNISNIQQADSGLYQCKINLCDSIIILPVRYIKVNGPPNITSSIYSGGDCGGNSLYFKVIPEGVDLNYRWYKNGQPLTVNDTVHGSPLIEFKILTPVIDNEDELYSLQLSNYCGTKEIDFPVLNKDCGLKIPNLITRNNDKLNDQFKVISIFKYSIYLYNRWGQQVYFNDNGLNQWEINLPDGVYYYFLKCNNCKNDNVGWVEIINKD